MERPFEKIVIVAEDEPLTQKVAAALLGEMGYRPMVCGNGRLCLDLFEQGVKPDLLLLDLEMPVMDGFAVLEALVAKGIVENFPIMMLTADNHQESVIRALKAGAHDYLVKPVNAKDLKRRITDLVFNETEAGIKAILANLHMPDPLLFRNPGLQSWAQKGYDAYKGSDQERALCFLVPEGSNPHFLAHAPFEALVATIHVFRHCAHGWRKVWPTYRAKEGAVPAAKAR